MAYYDDINNKKVLAIGVWGSLITFICVILLQAAYYQGKFINHQEKASEYVETVKMLEGQAKQLEGYKWVDQEKGIIGIPIEKSMDEVVKELQKPDSPKTASLNK